MGNYWGLKSLLNSIVDVVISSWKIEYSELAEKRTDKKGYKGRRG